MTGPSVPKSWRISILLPVLWFPAICAAGAGALPPRIELVGRWSGFSGNYADVWGDGEYAYLCHFGDAGLDVIDLGDPFTPTAVAEIRPGPPNQFASAQDAQVGDGLLFIALEGDGNDGVLIVDVRDPLHPVKKTVVTIPGFSDVHNVFIHNRVLYLANSRTSQVGIVDLADYNVDAAPARITDDLWTLNNVGTSLVHDITVQGSRLYACSWNSGLRIYDVSNVRRRQPAFVSSAPGTATHSCWATSDGRFVVTGEEHHAGPIKVQEIRPPSPTGEGSIVLRQTLTWPLSEAYSVHNQLISGFRLFDAWYQAGLVVHDIDPATGALTFVAQYDTSSVPAGGYNGAWGVYPFLGPDRVLVSDIENGLFVFDLSGFPKIHLAEGLPSNVNPVVPTPVIVRVLHERSLQPGSPVSMHVDVFGRGVVTVPMSPLGSGRYAADLPPIPCGSTARFYFSAVPLESSPLFDPPGAPGVTYSLVAATRYQSLLEHDFEQDHGWTSGAPGDTATTGLWTRGNPVRTSAQSENDAPWDGGASCWFTGQGPVDGIPHLNDVDSGWTTLLSPVFSAPEEDSYVAYARWFSNHLGPNPTGDSLMISISNDGGGSWRILETVTQGSLYWVPVVFRIADFIAPTQQMRLRFVAADIGGDSLVEAGIDLFRVFTADCAETAGDANGDGRVTLTDYQGFPACLSGPASNQTFTRYEPNRPATSCTVFDFNLDLAVDLQDAAEFAVAFGTP